MTKDKTNIEEIKGFEKELDELFNSKWWDMEMPLLQEKVLKLHKDQVQAECEKYLDEFVKYVFEQPMNRGLWHEYVENFKKEQREHE